MRPLRHRSRLFTALCAACLLGAVAAGAQCVEAEGEGSETAAIGGCATCSADKSACEECAPSWGLASDGTCVKCAPPGAWGDYCTKCNGDAPAICTECTASCGRHGCTGLFADETGWCVPCASNGCAACSADGACTECNSYLGLVDGACVDCTSPARTCTKCADGDVGKCLECGYETYLEESTGACKPCPPGCGECTAAADGTVTCGMCGYAFATDASGDCVACAANCTSCDGAPGSCSPDSCEAGFGFVGDKCEKCADANCWQCDGDTATCTACNPEWGVVDGACAACSANCTSCDGDAGTCTFCSEGGLDRATGECTACQKANCQSCSEDASRCDSCAEGFYWDDASAECVACGIADCAYCEAADTCLTCKAGFGLPAKDGSSCVACEVEHCSSCDGQGPGRCDLYGCREGWGFEDKSNLCFQCPEGCGNCDRTTCFWCAPGFWQDADSQACTKCVEGDTHDECSIQ